jgi:hypothetical protein
VGFLLSPASQKLLPITGSGFFFCDKPCLLSFLITQLLAGCISPSIVSSMLAWLAMGFGMSPQEHSRKFTVCACRRVYAGYY